jgi:hypothetical protein
LKIGNCKLQIAKGVTGDEELRIENWQLQIANWGKHTPVAAAATTPLERGCGKHSDFEFATPRG